MTSHHRNRNRMLKDILYGMIGGVVGTVALERVSNLMYSYESEEKKRKEEKLRKELPTEVAARRLSEEVLGVKVSDRTKSRLSQAIHWGTGVMWGGLYGALHDRMPQLSRAAGLPYGLAFWAIADEGMNALFGLTPPPQAFPIDAHIRGLVAHLAYAGAADGVLHAMRRLAG